MKDENRHSLLMSPALALPIGVKAFYTKTRTGSTRMIHSTWEVAQVTTPNQGAFDIKWYTFAPVILVHFCLVDNTRLGAVSPEKV